MYIESLINKVQNIGSIRDHFLNNFTDRDIILVNAKNTIDISIFELNKLITDYKSPEPYVLLVDNDIELIISNNILKTTKFIHLYLPSHIKSSIIRHIILHQSIGMKNKINLVVYLLYYYWYFVAEYYINTEIIEKVCTEIEDIINILLEKENTLYRQYELLNIIRRLRSRLNIERLALQSRTLTWNPRARL